MSYSLILNIPHSSTYIPKEAIHTDISFSEYKQRWEKEMPYLVDWFTDELYNNGIGIPIIAPVSRVICDTERFEDEKLETMAKIGMGVCYRTGHMGTEVFNYFPEQYEYVIENYYRIHHRNLEYATERVLSCSENPIILDCHSFSSVPLPYEPEKSPDRPDICIGTDSYHTPEELKEKARKFFEKEGFCVKLNSPYAGSIVPLRYYKTEPRVKSIMLEVNRKLYMDETTIKKNKNFQKIKEIITRFEETITDCLNL